MESQTQNIQSRWGYFSECFASSKRNWAVAMIVIISGAYSVVMAAAPFVALPSFLLVNALPKLPLPWAVAIALAGIAFIAIEGGYRLYRATIEARQAAIEEAAKLKQRELAALAKIIQEKDAEIERLTWPANCPLLRLSAWEQIPDNHPLAGAGTMGFPQHGFHVVNDGGPASEVRVEDFIIHPSALTVKSKMLSAIGERGQEFILAWVDGISVAIVGETNKWNLLHHVRQVSNPVGAQMPYGAADYVIPLTITYRGAREQGYCTTQNLHYIPLQGQFAFGPPDYKKIPRKSENSS